MNLPKLEELLKESSVSRFYNHVLQHDCAMITSFRNSDEKSFQENLASNKELKAYLLHKGYGVTDVKGTYIENYNTYLAKEVAENSFFVVNLKDDVNFINTIKSLGRYYNQDSVIIIEKGGNSSYLFGTNKTGYPSFGEAVQTGRFVPKEEAEFMTRVGKNKSAINFSDKPIPKTGNSSSYKDSLLETLKKHSINSKWAISKIYENLNKQLK